MKTKLALIRPCAVLIVVVLVSAGLLVVAVGCSRDAKITVTGMSVDYGGLDGEQEIVIEGSGFSAYGAVIDVTFDTVPCIDFEILSDSELAVVVPPHWPGVVDVAVIGLFGPSESGRMRHAYAYLGEPSVDDVILEADVCRPGMTVTICGSGFHQGVTDCVTFNGVPAEQVTVKSYCRLCATVPELEPGPVEVSVTTDYGTTTEPGLLAMTTQGIVAGWTNED